MTFFKLARFAQSLVCIVSCALYLLMAPSLVSAATSESGALTPLDGLSLSVPSKGCGALFQTLPIPPKSHGLVATLDRLKDSVVTKLVGDRSYKKLNQELFSSVFYSLMEPDAFQKWLTENMYSHRLSRFNEPFSRSYETGLGKSEYQIAENVQMTLFSSHSNVADAKSQNGFIVVLIRLEKTEDGKVIGMSYGGQMVQDYYFMFDAAHYDEVLSDIHDLRPYRDIDWWMVSSNGKDGVYASKTAAVFKLSKGRIVLRGSPYAGYLQYKEGDLLLRHDNYYGLPVDSKSRAENMYLYEMATLITRKIETALKRAKDAATLTAESVPQIK